MDALAAQTMPSFEAVIVDNASTDPPIDGLQLPDGRFRIERAPGNIGFAAGSNLGALARRRLGSPCSTLTRGRPPIGSPSSAPRPCAIPTRACSVRPSSTATTPGSSTASATRSRPTAWLGAISADTRRASSPTRIARSSRLAPPPRSTRRPVFEAAQGFDESFFCYLEDVDLGFRLRLNGERCVQVRRAEILHKASSVAGRMSAFSIFHSYRNRIWLLAKDMPLLLLGPAVIGWLAATIVSLARPRASPYRAAALRGTFAGIKGLPHAFGARAGVQRARVTGTVETARMLVWNPLKRPSAGLKR